MNRGVKKPADYTQVFMKVVFKYSAFNAAFSPDESNLAGN
jgi:hypothetical protein